MSRPLILVTNDDGIEAKGIHHLIDLLLPKGDVVCIAPDGPRSAQSMALTINEPLRFSQLPDYNGAKMYKVSGTPVDCVKVAMHTVLDRIPDLVVSGINHGSNAGVNVLYSGTMGAAMEGCLMGIASIGFSLTSHDPDADFTPCDKAVNDIVDGVMANGLPEGICLNVNIPDVGHTPEAMRVVKECRGHWNDEYVEYTDPMHRKFYWLAGGFVNDEPDNCDTDEWCLQHGIVSVVPVKVNRGTDAEPWLVSLCNDY